jgi:hypothetical protein
LADWYRNETSEVVSLLNNDAEAGLASAEAGRRLAENFHPLKDQPASQHSSFG